jgi:predicted RNA-binding protein YlxR (DUF448 family)
VPDRKMPMRMCVVCRQSKPKRELIRIMKAADGTIRIDESGKGQGRGAYICADVACIDRAYKTKALQKSMRTALSEESYEGLKRIAGGRNE